MSLKLKLISIMLRRARKKTIKKPPLLGKRFEIPRNGEPIIETYLYEPKNRTQSSIPALFNVHGGAWVGCDATMLDTQSQQLADTLGAYVVNINYKKLDVKPFPYPQTEARDAVLYFAEHAGEYGIDAEKFAIIGYSAGGHICAGAAMLLRDAGFKLSRQILCYPFLDFHVFDGGNAMGLDGSSMRLMNELFYRGGMNKDMPLMSPAAAPKEALSGLAPAEIILCGPDDLYRQGIDYCEHLKEAGVDAELKVFETSTHGFLEANYPESSGEPDEAQKASREVCIEYLSKRMKEVWRSENN